MTDTEKKLRVVPPPLYFLACLAMSSVLQFVWPVSFGIPSFKTGLAIGIALMTAGAGLAAWAMREMAKLKTPVEPWKRPVNLATSGPFRFTRNPIYLAFFLILAAIGVMADSAWIVASTIVLWFLLDRFVVRREEAFLVHLFGDEYVAFQSRVRRWL